MGDKQRREPPYSSGQRCHPPPLQWQYRNNKERNLNFEHIIYDKLVQTRIITNSFSLVISVRTFEAKEVWEKLEILSKVQEDTMESWRDTVDGNVNQEML